MKNYNSKNGNDDTGHHGNNGNHGHVIKPGKSSTNQCV